MYRCPVCGGPIAEGSAFCGKCGRPVSRPAQGQNTDRPPAGGPHGKDRPPKRPVWLIALIAFLATLLLVAVVLAVILLTKKHADEINDVTVSTEHSPSDSAAGPSDQGPGDGNPGKTPGDSGTTPGDSGTTPDDPGTTPDYPGSTPDDPGTKPDDPGTKPDDPGTKPDDPGTKPDDPGENGEPISLSMLDETGWWLCMGQTNGSQYGLFFHKNGRCSVYHMSTGTYEEDVSYTFSEDVLTLKLPGGGTEDFRWDGKSFTSLHLHEMQVGSDYYTIERDASIRDMFVPPVLEDGILEIRATDFWVRHMGDTEVFTGDLLGRIYFTDAEVRAMQNQSKLDLSKYGRDPIPLDSFHYEENVDFLYLVDDIMLSRCPDGRWLLAGSSDIPIRYVEKEELQFFVAPDVQIYDEMTPVLEYRWEEIDTVSSVQELFDRYPYPGTVYEIKVSGGKLVEITLHYSP